MVLCNCVWSLVCVSDLSQFYYEAPSRNKHLKAGTVFLYQVFPGNYTNWQRTFIRAARENQMETVDKMITFFRSSTDFINAKEPKTGHTALHHAARHGHFVRLDHFFIPLQKFFFRFKWVSASVIKLLITNKLI